MNNLLFWCFSLASDSIWFFLLSTLSNLSNIESCRKQKTAASDFNLYDKSI
ncbi:hypothetical protein V6Z11_A13G092900 [Gossypium hirsutum]